MNEVTNLLNFEDFKNENGITYWWASELLAMLGYKDMKSFHKVLDRATKAFVSLGIPHYENIIPFMKNDVQDFKLTRFACYLVTMNGNPKYPEVAKAQAYFIEQTSKFELFIQTNNDLDRMLTREELTEGNKALASIANRAGVDNFALFQDAGYRGLYNQSLWQLKQARKLTAKDNIADFMGRTELAANLFRITQTEERIKTRNIKGQAKLEETHFSVGREVREMVQKNTGKSPEQFKIEKEIPQIKQELKSGYNIMRKIDNKKKK